MFELVQTDETQCGICTSVGLCINILNSNYFGKNGNDLFLYCTGLKLKTVSFVICDDCESNLINCYQFIARCRELPSTVIDSPFTTNMIKEEMLETETPQVVTIKCDDHAIEGSEGYNGVDLITVKNEEMETDDEGHVDKTTDGTIKLIGEKSIDEIETNTKSAHLQELTDDKELVLANDKDSETDVFTSLAHEDETTDDTIKLNIGKPTDETNTKTVKPQELLKCSKCDKRFNFILDLRHHFHLTHHRKGFIQCKICFKHFKSQRAVRAHRLTHRNDETKGYDCDFCELKFATYVQLAIHIPRHMSERPFECKICGKSFIVERKLKQHLWLHIEDDEKKRFQCFDCGKKFPSNSTLKIHMVVHTNKRPFVCDLCGKNFKLVHQLKNHKKRHESRKEKLVNGLYECTICSKRFKCAKYYYNHKEKHAETAHHC